MFILLGICIVNCWLGYFWLVTVPWGCTYLRFVCPNIKWQNSEVSTHCISPYSRDGVGFMSTAAYLIWWLYSSSDPLLYVTFVLKAVLML